MTAMLQENFRRKLVVILSADAAGYTRLTEQNELSIHGLLKERLELIRENTSKFDGEIIRVHGDGCLCSFDSVINALKAALEIQHRSTLLNSSLAISNQIWFRIGIHLSEVIFDNCEPYGNGVNIAVRLQQKAKPGEIIVSQKTISALDSTRGFIFSKIKKIKVKNLTQPIYCAHLTGTTIMNNDRASNQRKHVGQAYYLGLAVCLCALLYSSNSYFYASKQSPTTFDEQSATSNIISRKNPLSSLDIGYQPNLGKELQIHLPKLITEKKIISSPTTVRSNIEFADISNKMNELRSDIQELKNSIHINSHHPSARATSTTQLLIEQNNFLEKLLNQNENQQFLRTSNSSNNYVSPQNYTAPQELVSSKHLIDTLDTLSKENKANSIQKLGTLVPASDTKYFGCMSCANQHQNTAVLDKDNQKILNKAILIGRITDTGLNHFGEKDEVLRNFIYQKLQYSISQSQLGKHIDEFSWLNGSKTKKVDEEYLSELCLEKEAILIASYELNTNYWNAHGAHLHFHHCGTKRSIHYFERNLSPTIYNVQKPYLSEDALTNVYKSVDYMVDKIVRKDKELL